MLYYKPSSKIIIKMFGFKLNTIGVTSTKSAVTVVSMLTFSIFGIIVYSKSFSQSTTTSMEDNEFDAYASWVGSEYSKNRYLTTLDDPRMDAQYAAVGIMNEASEISGAIMKDVRMGKTVDQVNMLEETGDVMFYLALWAWLSGFKFSDIVKSNMEKVLHIYPDGKMSVDNRNKSEELNIIKKYIKK